MKAAGRWRHVRRFGACGVVAVCAVAAPVSASARGQARTPEASQAASQSVIPAALEQEIRDLRARLQAAVARAADAGEAGAMTLADQMLLVESLTSLAAEIRALEARLAAVQQQTEPQPAKGAVVSAGADGFSVQSADGAFRLRLRGFISADGRFYLDDASLRPPDGFLIRRARPIVDVTVWKRFDLRIAPEFAQGRVVLLDGYIDARASAVLSARVGKFKSPFSLERLASEADLPLLERSLVSNLAPDRDVGVMAYGDLAGATVSYSAGAFDGAVDGASADVGEHDSKEVVGRVFVQPLRRGSTAAADLGFGAAATYDSLVGTAPLPHLPQFKTSGEQVFFRYRPEAVADGLHYRWSLQGYYYHGPFGLLAERVVSSQRVTRGDATADVAATGWEVTSSFALTGERESFQGMVPQRPLDPGSGQWGAWQLTARYSRLVVDDAAFPLFAASGAARAAGAWAAGITWYLNRNVKVMFNYERTGFAAPPGGVPGPAATELLGRFQLAF